MIIRESLKLGIVEVDEKQLRQLWIADAKVLAAEGSISCARQILNSALAIYPKKKKLWNCLIDLE